MIGRTAIAAMGLLLAGTLARAQEPNADRLPDLLTVGVGVANVAKPGDPLGWGRLEWRSGQRYWWVKPTAGFEVATDGALYGFAGFNIDVFLGRNVVLMPGFALGGWKDGSDLRLGFGLEFRSGVELAWRFDDHQRIGVSIHHLSNANLGDKNPGTESYMLNYSVPLSTFW